MPLTYDDNVREVYGSAANIARLGTPIQNMHHAPLRYYFYPTWRSQIFHLIGFFVLCLITIKVSSLTDYAIISGPLFSFGETTIQLSLPYLILIPGALLGKVLWVIYNSKYIVDERGVEAQVGLVSLNLRQPRLRYEDIRGVEPNQTIIERILGIGTVLIGSAMTSEVEIAMRGVANPRAIQLLIQGERDRRLRLLQQTGKEQQSQMSGD